MCSTSPTPISYSIDRELGVVLSVWHGPVSANDLREHWAVMLRDPEVLALRRNVADLRDAQIMFTGDELRALVSSELATLLGGRPWRTAIVTGSPLHYGVARQFQVFTELVDDVSVFENVADAVRWVTSQPT